MADLTTDQLKERFSSGDRPTQQDFHDLIDTLSKLPNIDNSVVNSVPSGPAGVGGGDLSGMYPNPTVKQGAIGLSHFSPLEANVAAPGGTSQDLAVAVFQGSTKTFVYRNWYSLPGLVTTGGSAPTPPGETPTPPTGTPTVGTVRMFSTGWVDFPLAYGEADGIPKDYDFDIGDFTFEPVNFWGEAVCDPADTAPDGTYTPFPADSIIPLQYFFSRIPGAATDADILTPLFTLNLVANHLHLHVRIPFSESIPVVQTATMTVDTGAVQNPSTRLSVIPINLANWRFRIKAIHVNL